VCDTTAQLLTNSNGLISSKADPKLISSYGELLEKLVGNSGPNVEDELIETATTTVSSYGSETKVTDSYMQVSL
jgi:hypothetical protein